MVNRDLTEIMYYFELMFPSTEYTKLKTNFRYEKWNFEDNKYEMDLDVLQAGLRYDFNENSHIQGTYAPELFSKSETGYSAYLCTAILTFFHIASCEVHRFSICRKRDGSFIKVCVDISF